MKVSLQWIQEFTTLNLTTDELRVRIGERLGAIEGSENWGSYYDEKIIVAEIVDAKEHADADKLGVYTVNTGSEHKTVVAGDKTLQPGNKVGYIPVGVAVPSSVKAGEPFVISEREMRGVVSEGMLGSADELLFNDNHTQVIVLDTDQPIGTSLKLAYKLDDIIFDIENKMFTHRPDCFGILGVAREIAGIQGIEFKSPDWYNQVADGVFAKTSDKELPIEVRNEIPELVPRFTNIALSNIEIKPSPLLVQSYLRRMGTKVINNVVDVTNFVMHLTAQPLHAMDYDKAVKLGSDPNMVIMVVRKPHQGEKLSLLDGRTIEPHENAILIATDTTAHDMGGCMGGSDSEVDENTKNVIIEVANFNMYSIRKTSYIHGIFTEAVSRFNKGQSKEQCDKVAAYAVRMLEQNAGAKVASDYIDEYPEKKVNNQISTTIGFINSRLASTFSAEEIAMLLRNVEMQVVISGEELTVTAPYWREDLEIPEDIVEEVGRLYGFNNLPVALPPRSAMPQKPSQELVTAQEVREIFAKGGAMEVLSYNFVSEAEFARSGLSYENAYHIRNALAPQLQYMRTQILPGLLEKVSPNIRQGHREFALFELGKTHSKQFLVEDDLPREQRRLSFVYAADDKATRNTQGAPYYVAKHYLEYGLESLHIADLDFRQLEDLTIEDSSLAELATMLTKGRSAAVFAGDYCLGVIGELSASIRKNYKLPERTAVFELDLARLEESRLGETSYVPLSRFPGVTQDITFKVPESVKYQSLEQSLANELAQHADIATHIEPKSIFQPEGASARNISFTVTFHRFDRTFKKEEVNSIVEAAVTALAEQLEVEQV